MRRVEPARRTACCGVFVVLLALLSPAAAREAAAPAPPRRGGEVVVFVAAPAYRLDPLWAYDATSALVSGQIHETLYRRNRQGAVEPLLAAQPPELEGPEKRRAIVRLRRGLWFHDGEPCRAADVVASIRRLVTDGKAPGRPLVDLLAAVREVDETTVEFELTGPSSAALLMDLLARPETGVVPARLLASRQGGYGKTGAVGTGPFRLVSWSKGRELVLEANPRYWGRAAAAVDEEGAASSASSEAPLPYLQKISVRVEGDAEKALRGAGLRRGGLVERLPPSLAGRVPRYRRLHLEGSPDTLLELLYLNAETPSLGDVRLRRSLSLAIDRRAIVERVFGGRARVATSVVPPGASRLSRGGAAYDPARARRLIGELRREGRVPTSFDLLTSDDETLILEARTVAEGVERVLGIAVEVRPLPKKTLLARLYGRTESALPAGETPAPYRAALEDWRDFRGGAGPLLSLWSLLHSVSPNVKKGIADPQLDELIEQAVARRWDPARRVAALERAERGAVEWATVVPLCFPDLLWAHDRRLHDVWRLDAGGPIVFREAWLEEEQP